MFEVIDFESKNFEAYIRSEILIHMPKRGLLIIAIADGGVPLAELAHKIISQVSEDPPRLVSIKCQRTSTKRAKKSNLYIAKLLSLILKALPTNALNFLRFVEHQYLTKHRSKGDDQRTILAVEPISSDRVTDILIVDDAVDTGLTLLAVVNFLKVHTNNKVKIVSLCATLTTENPTYRPDFYLFKNKLLRFPWSLDA